MLFYKNELLAEEIKQNYDTFDYNVSSLMKKKHVSIKRNIKSAFYKSAFYKSAFYKSAFYKSAFYKSAFYKSAFYKSAFCKSSPVQSSPRNTVCLLAEEIKQNYDTFDYNVSSLMKKKHVSIKRNIKSAFYKSAFYKSAFYKSAFCKSAFCKSSPVQSSPRNTVCHQKMIAGKSRHNIIQL